MGYINEERVRFIMSRSGGPGGQSVNKRSTKVQVRVNVEDLSLTPEEKDRVREKLAHRINRGGELEAESEEERSQEENRDRALGRLEEMIAEAIVKPAKRIPTKPPEGVEERFREERKVESLKKQLRKEGKDVPSLNGE